MERPSRGGEKRTAVWASHHEERGSDGAVAPPMCDHRVVLHRCVVREWCNPSGSAVATCLNAAARTRRAARAAQGDVVSVWQVLPGTPSAPPIPAQRVARFDDHCTHNCLLKNKLRQRYSRYRGGSISLEPQRSAGLTGGAVVLPLWSIGSGMARVVQRVAERREPWADSRAKSH